MNRINKWLALLLVLVMAGSLAACGKEQEIEAPPLEAACQEFSGIFSPFFAETIADRDAVGLTGLTLLNSDRSGGVVYHGIEGEVIPYNGTDYTYYGPADLNVTENEDGTVYYDFTLREDLVFSDGTPVTIDDVIFSMYVLCDPSYDGRSALYNQPIEGLVEYRQNNISLSALLAELGEDNTDFTYVTREQQSVFWNAVNNGMVEYVRQFADRFEAEANLYGDALEDGAVPIELTLAEAAACFDIELKADATEKEFALALGARYGWDFDEISKRASNCLIDPSLVDLSTLIPEEVYDYACINVACGESAPNIAGIQKTGEYSLRVVATGVDVAMIYQLGEVPIAPMHYYGDVALYDYENNSFGFPKGDLTLVRDKTSQPMGAGPYKFMQCEGSVISYEANESYYLGAPVTRRVNMHGVAIEQAANEIAKLVNGSLDVVSAPNTRISPKAIMQANGGAICGDIINVVLVNTQTNGQVYTRIGMNPYRMSVSGDPGSEASRNLRKAFCTIFAVYRDAALEGYSERFLRVMEYPVSGNVWTVPHSGDAGYTSVFDKDIEGNTIYTPEMTMEQRCAAAAQAALQYFEAAGYDISGGMCVAPPAGAALEYEIQVDASEEGSPLVLLLLRARDALSSLGINLIITNTFEGEDWSFPDIGTCDMWVDEWMEAEGSAEDGMWASWFSLVDPDIHMYHFYYSDLAHNGAKPGSLNYIYQLSDPDLDQLILDARATTDQTRRRKLYRECMGIIEEWACEVPVCQAQDVILFNSEKLDMSTIATDLTASYGWIREINRIALN